MNMIRRLFAAILLLGVVVGAPVALWVFGRDLLPDHVPSRAEVGSFFTQRDTGALFLGALVLIGVVAWLIFTISVLTELAALMAGRRGQWRIPGFRIPQRAAGALIAVVFTTTFAMANAMPASATAARAPSLAAAVQQYQYASTVPTTEPATHPTAAVDKASTRTAPSTTKTSHRTGPTWTVGRYDTLWRIAGRALGDGTRFQEIVELNQGVVQADGRWLYDADTPLQTGWILRLPAGAKISGNSAAGPALSPTTAPRTTDQAPADDVHVKVAPGDTLSGIVQRVVGDGSMYPTVAAANHLADPNQIVVGDTISIPTSLIQQAHHSVSAAPASTVRLDPGQTLSDIALREWGDADLWPVLAKANHITDPANILAGSSIVIPATHLAAAATKPPTATPRPDHPDHAQPRSVSAPASTPLHSGADEARKQRAAAQQRAGRVDHHVDAVAAEQSRTEKQRSAITQKAADAVPVAPMSTTGPTARSAPPQVHNDSHLVAPLIGLGGGGVLLTGLVLAALTRARRRQFRHRRPGRTIAATPPELADIERSVLTSGRRGALDVQWLDLALRSLVHALAERSESALPTVVAARLGENELELVLATPANEPPAPWTSDELGQRWSVARSASLTYSDADRDYHFAPFPALVSVGYTPAGDHWLLDLEQIGSMSLTGDPHRCLNLARFMASELSFNSWSEMLQVTLVGFGAEMAALNPDRLVYAADLDTVMTGVQAQLASVGEVMDAAQVDVAGGRLHDVAADTWAPHVVLIAPQVELDTPDVQEVLTTLRSMTGRLTVALILAYDESDAEPPGTRWQLHVDSDGVLSIPALDVQLVAEQVPQSEAAALAQLMAMASAISDRPVPASGGDRPWDEFADQLGALRPEMTVPAEPRATVRLAGLTTPRDGSVLPLAVQEYVAAAAATETDIEVLAPKVSDEIRQRVIEANRDLDDEVTQWWDPSCARPKVRVLGPVGVDLGPQGADSATRSPLYTEIVAYLTTRPRGATMAQIGSVIWPGEPDIERKSKVKNAISRTRRWLGTNPATGRDYLPPNPSLAGSTYRIDGVLIDMELFRRLRTRGAARGADGIADFEAALALVAGVPFDDQRPNGYGWLSDNRVDDDCTAMISDVSHIVATHYLAINEPEKAAAAAQVALKAGSHEDTALLDAAGGCFDAGNRAEGASYIKRIMARHGAEEEEDLPKRTYEILLRRGWLTG